MPWYPEGGDGEPQRLPFTMGEVMREIARSMDEDAAARARQKQEWLQLLRDSVPVQRSVPEHQSYCVLGVVASLAEPVRSVPLTRRQRAAAVWREARWRVREAWLILRHGDVTDC